MFKLLKKGLYFTAVFVAGLTGLQAQILEGLGTVSFVSVAPLETIKASSKELRGLIDLEKQTFAFTLSVKSFEGFNSPLQKEHFNEHYLESKKFPKSIFTGKMIGFENCEIPCEITIYAKGKLTLHGITQVATIPVKIQRTKEKIVAVAEFTVELDDYGITAPKILEAKIAPEISVKVDVEFTKMDENL